MGGNENQGVLFIVCDNGPQDEIPGGGIDAGNGFIQNVNLCLTAHGENQLGLFTIAFGETLQRRFLVDLEGGKQLMCPFPVKVPEEIGVIGNQLADAHVVREKIPVRQKGDTGLTGFAGLLAIDQDFTGGGLQKAAAQLDQRGFSAAVGTEETDDLSGFQIEVHMIQRRFTAVLFGQIVAGNSVH